MEETKKTEAAPAEAKKEAPRSGNRNYEPHGSYSSGRPGDRKYGDRKGRPGERRGGRGGFRGDRMDDYKDKVVDINRVSKTVSGGKHMRFDALVVVGDGQGKYGFAMAKSGEVPDAIKKALTAAKKRMHKIHLVRGGTIAHEVVGVYGSTKVTLKPAPAGTGIIAGGAVRAVVELAGIKNVVSKVNGSRTRINVIRATSAALDSLKEYNTVMVLRGKKSPEEIKAKREPKATRPEAKEGE